MTAQRITGAAIGIVFGIVLCWSGMTSPNVIRDALLFNEGYLFLFMGSAVATATIGMQLLKRRQARAALADCPVEWTTEQPERRHVAGSIVFGGGWAVSCACPGPIATQVGQGVAWSLFTLVGVAGGIYLFQRRSNIGETEPAADQGSLVPLAARS